MGTNVPNNRENRTQSARNIQFNWAHEREPTERAYLFWSMRVYYVV